MLTRSQVKASDKDTAIHSGYERRVFSFFSLMDTGKIEDKELFLGAPLMTRAEVQTEANLMLSRRMLPTPMTPTESKVKLLPPVMMLVQNSDDELSEWQKFEMEHGVSCSCKVESIHAGLVKLF